MPPASAPGSTAKDADLRTVTTARGDFDVLDATKIVPEALVPVQRVGRITLNRNPDNYVSETEQVAQRTAWIGQGAQGGDPRRGGGERGGD